MLDGNNVDIDKAMLQPVSQFFKTISDPTRLSILFLLQKKEMNVGDIAAALDMHQSAISHQLSTLKKNRLVKPRRDGKTIFYSLDDDHVFKILEQVMTHTRETIDKESN